MQIAEYLYREFVKAGMTEEGACGMLGNIEAESGFVVNNLEDRANRLLGITDEQYTRMVDSGEWQDFENDSGVHGGYGLIQVTLAARKRMFLNFMKSRNKSIADLEGQAAFILWELKNMYPPVWSLLCSSHDLYECTREVLYKYENPLEKTENMKRRYAMAQKWQKEFGSMEVKRVTQKEAVNRVLNLARAEIGYHQKASNSQLESKTANSGSGNWTKYAADLDARSGFYNGPKNGYAWCDVFVDYLFVQCFGQDTGRQMLCQPMNSAGAGCLYSAQYYKQYGRWHSTPEEGDQIFFSYSPGEYSHTGIVESVSGGTVTTIEGNTSDQVARRNYPLSSPSIAGYGRPRWELATGSASAPVSPAQPQPTPAQGSSSFILRKGASGSMVKEYQTKLMKLGYDLGRWGADGDFGNDTLRAVIQFQNDHGLEADGEIGPMTSAAIIAEYNKLSEAPKEQAPADRTFFAIGDMVSFTGSKQYKTAGGESESACKPGRALVIGLNKGAKFPYQLCKINNFGSTVYGWTAYDTVKAL